MRLLRLWPDESHFDFMRYRRFSFPLSAAMSVITVVLFLTMGLNFGIDFKGGTLVELQAKSGTADVAAVRHTANGFGFGESEVQELGGQGNILVRFPLQAGEQGQTAVMQKAHTAFDTDYEFRRTETVGPRVSGELVQSGTLGVVLSVVAVLLYLWFRFERELALGAIVGTLHDIVLTVGIFIL
ncbi:MAG TPA: protein translocase subunit SecF, partial [Methylobacterium sp.]|nr:protein translocase subunit SecF [Methylobacterium sp.]